ncbi:LuxR C-terminal-related transcriptional regulator [Streptomyces sp. NPDC020800]|uniref:helix-turn-helix transcriptional regulator n=1 Tax=Streptomyces sp. NPDC020800 TaxID=3365092 RepID=UPI0037AD6BE9
MLESLDLDPLSEQIYLSILTRPGDGIAALAQHLGRTEAEIRTALDRLSELSLVHLTDRESTRFQAVSPQYAMDLLLARQEAQLAQEQLRVKASRAAAARLLAQSSLIRPTQHDPSHELLQGIDAIRARLARLGDDATSEVMTLAPGGSHSPADLEASRTPNTALLSRGVQVRTVYLDSVRNDRPTLDHLSWLASRGAEVRTKPTLPTRLIIVDRRLALLPVDPADARDGAVLVSNQGTIAALCALFEQIWSDSTPLGQSSAQQPRDLSRQETEVLHLLATGLTDQAIATRLGVSPRTARRLAAELMERLDARSRFEAGVHAVQRGWLPTQD